MSNLRSSLSLAWAVPVVLGLGVVACENQQKTTQSESNTQSAAKAPTAPATIPPSSMAQTSREELKPSQLEDAQIAAILVALNQGEIHEAEQVEPHVTAADVKTFAMHMKTAHTGMLDRAQEAFSKEHITPAPNTLSERLDTDAVASSKSLGPMQGTALDEAYMAGQVKAHEGAALMLDDMLTAVKNGGLKSVLETEHDQIENHLSDALRVERSMRPAVASKEGSPSKR